MRQTMCRISEKETPPPQTLCKPFEEENKMKKKNVLALALALCLAIGTFAGCSSASGSASPAGGAVPAGNAAPAGSTAPAEGAAPGAGFTTVEAGKLTVATSPDFAPMEFVDASKSGQDQYVGFDITLAKHLAEQMGLELVITPMDFNACQVAVAMGSVDMAISGFSWTYERSENYNLSDSYHAGDNEDGQTTICLASDGDKYADAPHVEGLKVGVQGASLQELLAKEQLTNAQVIPFQDLTTAVMQLRNGDFDIMACADGNASAIIAANPDLALTGFDFEVSDQYKDNLILLQKGNDALTAKVNEILAAAKESGVYAAWYDEAKALAGIDSAAEISYDEDGNPITD